MANKKRLIDVNEYPCQSCNVSYCYQNCPKFIAWFEKTVDAVEVVHGQWRYDCSSYRIFCSACNENALELKRTTLDGVEYVEEILTDYCPNCGARMDLQ